MIAVTPWEVKEFDEAQVVVLGAKHDGGKQELVAVLTGDNRHDSARIVSLAPYLLNVMTDIGCLAKYGDFCSAQHPCRVCEAIKRAGGH